MALFRITVKQSRSINGVRLEKGMTVEVAKGNNTATPTDIFGTIDGKKMVALLIEVNFRLRFFSLCLLVYLFVIQS